MPDCTSSHTTGSSRKARRALSSACLTCVFGHPASTDGVDSMRLHTTQSLRIKIPAWYLLVKRSQGLWLGLCFHPGGHTGCGGRGVCFQDCHSQRNPRSPSEGLGALPCTLGSHCPSYTVVRTQDKEGPFERTEKVIRVSHGSVKQESCQAQTQTHSEENRAPCKSPLHPLLPRIPTSGSPKEVPASPQLRL